MKKFSSAIIGCGAIFPMHAASILNNKNTTLVAVCDTNEERAKNKAEQCKCDFYTDYKAMIEAVKPDVVHICLPHYLHAPVSMYAMEHGCDVICEKPMATTVSDAEKMIATSKKTGKKLEIIFQNRYNAASILIKNTIESGKLGKVLGARATVCWTRSTAYYSESGWRGTFEKEGGSVCVNQAIHTLDLMLWFTGKNPLSVKASIDTRTHNIETEDDATGTITFDDNTYANFWFSVNYCIDAPVEIEICCENGIAHLVGDKAEITFKDGEILKAQKDENDFVEYGDMKAYWGMAHIKQVNNFYNNLLADDSLPSNYNDAFATHKVMCAILKSGKTGTSVTIE